MNPPSFKTHRGLRPRSFAALAAATAMTSLSMTQCLAQSDGNRVLGVDVSIFQGTITWSSVAATRQFTFIRACRGGTTGEDHRQGGYPSGNNTFYDLSERYDDPNFISNINSATAAGMFAGPYIRTRADIVVGTLNSDGSMVTQANTGTDDATHFVQMAGPWMRPGYLLPVMDFEDGSGQRTDDQMAQFAIDFSTQVFTSMGIRPMMYVGGDYSANVLQTASLSLRNQIAQPGASSPTVNGPAFPVIWNPRYANQGTPNNIPFQASNPKDTYSGFYGPFDDYGISQPWAFWQYASTGSVSGISGAVDLDVAHGGLEFLKDNLVPAVWMNDSSGDWGTLANWNSGQTPTQPPTFAGQLTPVSTGPLPTPRLPGAAGSGPTAGSNDTVILERPSASITVTISSGSYNIRKLYAREALNISGGSLNINYSPSNDSTPFSAQFSSAVTISGTASYSAHTTNITAGGQFNINGGTVNFNNINLNADASNPGRIVMGGDATIGSFTSGTTATITAGGGSGIAGTLVLGNANRTLTVPDGAAAVDASIQVPISTGGLIKAGAGLLQLTATNTYALGTTVNAGTLRITKDANLGAVPGSFQASNIILNGGTLQTGTQIDSLTFNGGGSGYTSFPTVSFTGAGADNSAASANVMAQINSIAVTNGGSGYIGTAPLVLISGGGGTGATATATLSGGAVTAVNITNPGSGYTSAPTVYIYNTAGTFSGQATAAVSGIGITGVSLTSAGFDYANAGVSITGG